MCHTPSLRLLLPAPTITWATLGCFCCCGDLHRFWLQVRQPFQPRQSCGVNAASLRTHGGAGGLHELCAVQVFQGEAVAAVHLADGAVVPVLVLHSFLAAQSHVEEISLDTGEEKEEGGNESGRRRKKSDIFHHTKATCCSCRE